MKPLRFFIWSTLVACLLPLSVHAAGLWLYEQATPDTGSASAGRVALAMDASTASVNPAGMTQLDRSQLLAGIQML
jgi:long-chain fatty acid transport protein